MSTSRREFMAGSAALVAALSNVAGCAKKDEAAATRADVEALLADIAEQMLSDYPENATSLGIDIGARAGLKARLTDRSIAGQNAIATRVSGRLELMRAIQVAALDDRLRVDLDVVQTAHRTAAEGFRFPYGDVALLNQNW